MVNDVTSAGSAVRGTYTDLLQCNATPIAIGTLALLGDAIRWFPDEHNIPLETLGSFPNVIWRRTNAHCARAESL